MNRYALSTTNILTMIVLSTSWTILISANPMPQQDNGTVNINTTTSSPSTRTVNINSNIRLSNNEALQQLLLAAYRAEQIRRSASTTTTVRTPTNIPPLLEYENETIVENLESVVRNDTASIDLELPANVYEVPLEVWINEESSAPSIQVQPTDQERPIDETQRIILEALQASRQSTDHTIRHRGRRLATRSQNSRSINQGVSEDAVSSVPIRNIDIDRNILNLLQRQQEESAEANGALNILRQRDRFNLTVDYQATFHNIGSTQLEDIMLVLSSNCSQLRSRKVVRWLSSRRGILFECRNGAWVSKYLSKRNRKPRTAFVTGNSLSQICMTIRKRVMLVNVFHITNILP